MSSAIFKTGVDGFVLLCTDCVQMCALVFGPVTGIAEGLEAAGMLADVWFLTGVAPQVDLQVFQTWKRFGAAFKLTRNAKKRFCQLESGERITFCQIILPVYDLQPRKQQHCIMSAFRASHPERDVRVKWQPCEYGLLKHQNFSLLIKIKYVGPSLTHHISTSQMSPSLVQRK